MFGEIVDGIPLESKSVEFKHENGVTEGIGKIAVNDGRESDLKIGHWKEYNNKGVLQKEGTYKLGTYIQCCFGGPCRRFYFYQDGLWKYYNSNGELSYELTFEPTELHIDTSCEGGDKLIFGIVKRIPFEYDHIVTTDTIIKNQKVLMKTDFGIVKMVPLNGIVYWE